MIPSAGWIEYLDRVRQSRQTEAHASAMAAVAGPCAVLASGSSVSDVGYVAAAGLIPTVAFLLFGGVLADRLPRQRVMVAANVGQGLAQGGKRVAPQRQPLGMVVQEDCVRW